MRVVAWLQPIPTVFSTEASCSTQLAACCLSFEHLCDRRKQREARKFSKAVQAERLKEKAQSKKAGVEALTRLRKQRQRQGFAGAWQSMLAGCSGASWVTHAPSSTSPWSRIPGGSS